MNDPFGSTSKPTSRSLASDEVHVGICSLDEPQGARRLDCLSVDEKARAQRFHATRDRDRFVAGRVWLRHVLSQYTGVRADRIGFEFGPQGKPRLPGAAQTLQFNLSHSGGVALLALSLGRSVGADIEAVRLLTDDEAIARRHFAAAEFARWQSLPAGQRQRAFFTCWTRKEAYVKALGGGLSVPLSSFEVSLSPGEPAALLSVAGDRALAQRWSMWDIAVSPGFVAAVASEGTGMRLHRFGDP